MTIKQQSNIVPVVLVATPIICLLLGILARTVSNHELNDDGSDWSLILPYLGIGLGLVGSAVGLFLGTLTAFLTRKSNHPNYILFTYFLPAGAAILYMICVVILNA